MAPFAKGVLFAAAIALCLLYYTSCQDASSMVLR